MRNRVALLLATSLAFTVLSGCLGSQVSPPGNEHPVAVLSGPGSGWSGSWLDQDRSLHFDAGHSYDPDDELYSYSSYSWEFGDGKIQSYGTEADHIYEIAGVFKVNVTVRDEHGAGNIASLSVKIRNPENITVNSHGVWTEGIWNYGDYFVNITMQNQAPFAMDINDYYGFSLETAGESYSWNGHKGIIPNELLSGGSATWVIFFELPPGAIPLRLVYDDHIIMPLV
jgi:hypothetical protein